MVDQMEYRQKAVAMISRYNDVAVAAQMLKLDLEAMEQAIADGDCGSNNMAVDYSLISGGRTNRVNSVIESEIVAVQENLRQMRRQIRELELHNRRIDMALENMPVVYSKLLRLRYLDNLGWKKIEKQLGWAYSEDHIRKVLHEKAVSVLASYLFPEIHQVGLFSMDNSLKK